MTLYELLKKPDETVQEASIRQHALGGADLFQANRQDMLEKFRQYVKENRSTGYRIPWSQWLISHEKGHLLIRCRLYFLFWSSCFAALFMLQYKQVRIILT